MNRLGVYASPALRYHTDEEIVAALYDAGSLSKAAGALNVAKKSLWMRVKASGIAWEGPHGGGHGSRLREVPTSVLLEGKRYVTAAALGVCETALMSELRRRGANGLRRPDVAR